MKTCEEEGNVFVEIVIRYDNKTYFKGRITMLIFDLDKSGYNITNLIKEFKNNIK